MPKILFVCVGNMVRSPIAKAYYNFFTKTHDASSAGILHYTPDMHEEPDKDAIKVMEEDGIDISNEEIKTITPEIVEKADKVIVMFNRKYAPKYLHSHKTEFWDVEDPLGKGIKKFREVRDIIKKLIEGEINSIN